MKKPLYLNFLLLIYLGLLEISHKPNPVKALIPNINEPNPLELESISINIGKTAIQLIQFGQNNEAIKLLKLAVKLNPKEHSIWITLAEAQIRSNKNKEAIFSLNQAIELQPKKESIYFTKGSVYMNLNNPQKAIISIKKGLSINNNTERGYFQLGNAQIMLKNYKYVFSFLLITRY